MSFISMIQSAINNLRRMKDETWRDDDFTYDQGYFNGYHSALNDLEDIFTESDEDAVVESKASRRFYDDRCPDKIITEDELLREYELSDIRFDLTFHQWLRSCMTYEGGTLEEIFE